MELIFNVEKQVMTRTDSLVIASHSRKVHSCSFTFSEEWQGMEKSATFKKNHITYDVLLDNNTCIIPSEVLRSAGAFEVGVYGSDGQRTITSNLVLVEVVAGSPTEGIESRITPSLFEQIIKKINEVKKGEVEPELILEAVNEYLTEHPLNDIVVDEVAAYVTEHASELKGDKGDKGDRGEKGEQGIQGIQGERGEQGLKGDKGEKGDKGDTGATGAQGIQGIQGEKGAKGDTGEIGKSAYQIAVDNGFSGTESEWLASLKGEKGERGEQGIQGEKGEKGDTGAKGDKGDKGEVTQAQLDEVVDDLSDVKSAFSRNTGDTLYSFVKGGYIKTDTGVGATVDLTPVQSASYEYIVIDCSANDQFMYKAWGSAAARQYAFIDENNVIIEVAGEYAETTRYSSRIVPANAAKLIINSRISKGEAGVYKTPTINERLNLVMLESGSFLTAARNATNGAAFDGRSMFNYDPSTLQGKIVKIRFECDDSIFPHGLYWMSGNGKYLSGSAQLYKPNTDYYVAVGDSFATSGNKYSGLYGAASLVQGSDAVTAYFYPEFESSRGYLQYQINNWHGNVQNIVADMLCWGDSLTAGAGGDGTTYPTVCASELGISVRNCGVGGETGNTIAARQGGNTVVIPPGAINGTYSSLTDIYGTQIAPLLQGNGNGSGNKLYINGEECSLSYNNGTYTISGYTGEASIVPLLGRFSGSNFRGRIVTIWCGANGARIGNDTGVTARIAIIDSMIRQIGHEQFVIFGNWTSTGTEEDFTDDDAAMLAHYGNKFFNVRKMLVDYGLTLMNITPTTQDETDIADGRIPSSLRSDSVHLNANGYTAVGKFLADKIRSLGYV